MIFNSYFKFLGLLTSVFLAIWSVNQVKANWTPPSTAPYFCPTNDPACSAPLNVTVGAQIKTGAFGVGSSTTDYLEAKQNFFSPKAKVGPGFIDLDLSLPLPITNPVTPTLDLAGQISIRGTVSEDPKLNKVLTSDDSTGLASWQDYLWKLANNNLDIFNTNFGNVGIGVTPADALPAKLTINGSIGKFGNMLNGGNKFSHVNLGSSVLPDVSQTGAGVLETVAGASVLGGVNNVTAVSHSVIAGGRYNVISNSSASNGVVAGGGSAVSTDGNRALDKYSGVLGGSNNQAGKNNAIPGSFSLVPGGLNTRVEGVNSFVWANPATQGIYTTDNSFLIFPNDPSPATGRVGIGATPDSVTKLNVMGGIKATDSTLALEVIGPVKLNLGTSENGQVFTATSTNGAGEWQTPSISIGGSAVMYLRRSTTAGPLPNCPVTAGWVGLAPTTESAGSYANNVRVCYNNTSQICQVIELKNAIPLSGSPVVDPAECPTFPFFDDNSDTYLSSVHAGLGATAYLNRVRTCYRCSLVTEE